MEQRKLREEIFKILFEHELVNTDIEKRILEFKNEHKISQSKMQFFEQYIHDYIDHENEIVGIIKDKLNGWTFERLGVTEKVLLKMSFTEIVLKKNGYEIAINEAVELSKIYGDIKTKEFINGILATLVKDKVE